MSINFVTPYDAVKALAWSATRLADGLHYDFADNTFKSAGWTARTAVLAEGAIPYTGRYAATVATPDPAQWTDGWYEERAHFGTNGPVIAIYNVYIEDQSDLIAPWGSRARAARIDLTTPLAARTDATVGGALHGAYAYAWTEAIKVVVAKTLSIVGMGTEIAPAKTFDLDDATNPTRKVPR